MKGKLKHLASRRTNTSKTVLLSLTKSWVQYQGHSRPILCPKRKKQSRHPNIPFLRECHRTLRDSRQRGQKKGTILSPSTKMYSVDKQQVLFLGEIDINVLQNCPSFQVSKQSWRKQELQSAGSRRALHCMKIPVAGLCKPGVGPGCVVSYMTLFKHWEPWFLHL